MSHMHTPSSRSPGDPLIDEIRAIRHRISEQFGHDVGRLIEHLREIELREPARVILPAELKRQLAAGKPVTNKT